MAIGLPAFTSLMTGMATIGILGNMPISVFFTLTSISLGALLISIVNWHWQKTLRTAMEAGLIFIDKRGISIKEMLLVVAAISVVLAAAVPNLKPLQGHQVPAKDAPFFIPAGARDVTYDYTSYTVRYECTIDEQSFLNHFADANALEPFSGGRIIQAFSDCSTVPYQLGDREITEGWIYKWNEEDRGRYITYDRPTQRLYYYFHSR